MFPALFKRLSEEHTTNVVVVANDITQREGSGFHGGHAPRAETRGAMGLLHLSRRHGTAAGDCSIELGYLDRFANYIMSGVHFWKSLAAGRGRPILLGSTVAEHLTALQKHIIQ